MLSVVITTVALEILGNVAAFWLTLMVGSNIIVLIATLRQVGLRANY
jgi:hypothetical protein